jgi:hypothetical protein
LQHNPPTESVIVTLTRNVRLHAVCRKSVHAWGEASAVLVVTNRVPTGARLLAALVH